MEWAYAITTVASRHTDLLPKTVTSLAKAGFDKPVLFVDGMIPNWRPPSQTLSGMVFHEPPAGHLANWIGALTYLYAVFPTAERYALFEDDLLACSNLRTYLEQGVYPDDGYLNLLTHNDNLLVTQGVEGWHLSNQRGRGAVGLVFSRAIAGKLLASPVMLERPSVFYRKPAADGMVIDSLSSQGIKEYVHFPTLLQHTGGGQSTMGHRWGEMVGWRGEEYNPLELLEKPKVTSDTTPAEQACLEQIVLPKDRRPAVWLGGVIQIHVTRACDMACFGCTQGSNLRGKPVMISLEDFETACYSLRNYWGVVGMFGGNPAVHPQFEELCKIFARYIQRPQRGLWCNHPRGKGATMRCTFNPSVSNLNVHLSQEAYDEFKRDWPESMPVGLREDSRHSPPYVAMQDIIQDVDERWKLIGNCDINRNWSAMVCSIPGKGLRGFFCEIAGAQAILHANDADWPDTGVPVTRDDPLPWWQLGMPHYQEQVRWHCHRCGVPLRRYGQLATAGEYEEVSQTHANIYQPKAPERRVELVTVDEGPKLGKVTQYLQNSTV